jgi:hypothetical protein
MVASVYVNTGMIGDRRRLMSRADWGHDPEEYFLSWGDLDQIAKAGWGVGSHGVDHVDLTWVPGEKVSRQTTQSKSTIERILGVSCVHFASGVKQRNRSPARIEGRVHGCSVGSPRSGNAPVQPSFRG